MRLFVQRFLCCQAETSATEIESITYLGPMDYETTTSCNYLMSQSSRSQGKYIKSQHTEMLLLMEQHS
jgi:hypothetical protein